MASEPLAKRFGWKPGDRITLVDLPLRDAHDALNDAVMAGLAFIKLRELMKK